MGATDRTSPQIKQAKEDIGDKFMKDILENLELITDRFKSALNSR